MITKEELWNAMAEVPDPEIPVISIIDLGVVRDIRLLGPEQVEVMITPTYSGCPAMGDIAMSIRFKLMELGFRDIHVEEQLSPAWSTDWLSAEGKKKMKAYGIAPPVEFSPEDGLFENSVEIACPQCGSIATRLVSQFGSTACKALYQCNDCLEPFDYFKCHR